LKKPFRDLAIYPETCETILIFLKQFRLLIIHPSIVKLFRHVKLFKELYCFLKLLSAL